MGFGLLFIGFFIAYLGAFIPEISILTCILGSGIILLSLRKLVFENKMFLVSLICTISLEISSLFRVGIELLGDSSSTFYTITAIIHTISQFATAISLMLAIVLIARSVELKKISNSAIVNAVFISICAVFTLISTLVKSDSLTVIMSYIGTIFQVIYTLFALFIIFNSYVRICYEEDKNMERTESGIAPMDFLNRLLDKAFTKKNKK